jgi:hypothetical protein
MGSLAMGWMARRTMFGVFLPSVLPVIRVTQTGRYVALRHKKNSASCCFGQGGSIQRGVAGD